MDAAKRTESKGSRRSNDATRGRWCRVRRAVVLAFTAATLLAAVGPTPASAAGLLVAGALLPLAAVLGGLPALLNVGGNVLRNLAEAHPLLLVLDDLQWADAGSSAWRRMAKPCLQVRSCGWPATRHRS